MDENIHLRYLIVSEKDKQWGLTVSTVGRQTILRNGNYPPKEHPHRYLFSKKKGRILNEYQLLYIVAGRGTFISSHCKETTVEAGTMFLLFPGEWHNYYPDKEEGWTEYWVGFRGVNIDNRVDAKFFSRNSPVLNIGMHDRIVDLYKHAMETASGQRQGFQVLLAGIVNHLLGYAYALGESSVSGGSEADVMMGRIREYIFEHLHEQIYPENIARHLNMSYTSFRRFFKNYTGFSPAAYILEQKINKCKELLTNSNDTSQQIAFRMGFESPDYFCTVFKRKIGMTPIEYRNFTQGRIIDFYR